MRQTQKGITEVLLILVVVAIAAFALLIVYKAAGNEVSDFFDFSKDDTEEVVVTGVSDSTEPVVMQEELEDTNLGDLEEDFEELEGDLEEL